MNNKLQHWARLKIIFYLLTCLFELIFIFLLFTEIKNNKKKVLGALEINPINKDNLIFPDTNKYKYFFELEPNRVVVEKTDYIDLNATYTVNLDGLNERYNYVKEKPPFTYRIIAIGDSHTFGHFVDTNLNYPEQLEDILNRSTKCHGYDKFEVINLGVSAYDIPFTIHHYYLRGLKYNADLILWFLKSDDFLESVELTQIRRQEIEQEAKNTGKITEYIKNGDYHFAWRIAHEELVNKYGIDKLIDKNYSLLADFAKSSNQKILLFTYGDENKIIKTKLKQLADNKDKIYFFDGFSYFDLERFSEDYHPTSKGYGTLSKIIYKYLFDEKIIPCD